MFSWFFSRLSNQIDANHREILQLLRKGQQNEWKWNFKKIEPEEGMTTEESVGLVFARPFARIKCWEKNNYSFSR